MKATFIADQIGAHNDPLWSNPKNWAGGEVPQSSKGLHVVDQGFGMSIMDLGTASCPFVAKDVISANLGLNESVGVSGFLSLRDIKVPDVEVVGNLDVRHRAAAENFGLSASGTLEIEHDFGNASFRFNGLNEGTGAFGDPAA